MNDQLNGVTEGSSQTNTWPAVRMALVHLEDCESAESAERTMSGHDKHLEALSYKRRAYVTVGETYLSRLMTCGDARNCTWTYLAIPTLAGANCAQH